MIDLKYFSQDEFDDPEMMDETLLLKLDNLRRDIGSPIIITSSTRGLHSTNSSHYKGKALDIMILDPRPLFDQYLFIERYSFKGVGIYPQWKYKNWLGGFHIDERKLPSYKGSRWMGIKENGSQRYVGLVTENIKKYGIV